MEPILHYLEYIQIQASAYIQLKTWHLDFKEDSSFHYFIFIYF